MTVTTRAQVRRKNSPQPAITMVMPMIPALIFMFWCELYPTWLRVVGLIPSLLFALVYVNVNVSGAFLGLPLYAGYATLHVLEVMWSVYLFNDWRRASTNTLLVKGPSV